MTLGSLFDGIGGFPLTAVRYGITPIWASEIESAAIKITKRHFPDMKHLGDIKKVNGAEIEPVDIITFGSPCQDLSLAGLRKGIEGSQSGLFFEAVRIIKEMQEKTNGRYPTRIIWENVNGAFSSNKGDDFWCVLKEIASLIPGGGATIPRPSPKSDESDSIWECAGAIMGDSWSIAWRTLDAQYWGVPQRRKRIFLVADFGRECAGEILFKPDGLQGNSAEGEKAGKEIASDIARGFGETGIGYWQEGIQCLRAEGENRPSRPSNLIVGVDGHNQNITGDVVNTLRGGRVDKDNIGLVILNDQGGSNLNVEEMDIAPCLRSETHGNLPIVTQYAVDFGRTADRIQMNPQKAVTLQAEGGGGGAKTGLYCLPATVAIDCRNHEINNELSATLQSKPNGGQSLNYINPIASYAMQGFGDYKRSEIASTIKERDYKDTTDLICNNYIVRRLTPLECERLQGFPDMWTKYGFDEKPVSDSQRYKTLGNSLAIPCVERVFAGIVGVES